MGLLDFLEKSGIDEEVEKFRKTKGAILLDVRSEDDYKKGHIPGSINIPEKEIMKAETIIEDHNTIIFIYCLSGAKSWNAEKKLKELGYVNAKSIGGINGYTGPRE